MECVFRTSGKQPEIWDPLVGEIREAKGFTQKSGRTHLPLEFAPYGSMFLVFRRPVLRTKNGEAEGNFPTYEPVATINGTWEVRFDSKWGGPAAVKFDRLVSWTARPEEGIKFYSGKATYRTEFEFAGKARDEQKLFLDLGDVRDVGTARVRLNGRDLGVVWTPPFRVQINDALRRQNNQLEVEVINSWRNRLVGDRELPENRRLTRTNITIRKEWELLDSGLLGPIQILAGKN